MDNMTRAEILAHINTVSPLFHMVKNNTAQAMAMWGIEPDALYVELGENITLALTQCAEYDIKMLDWLRLKIDVFIKQATGYMNQCTEAAVNMQDQPGFKFSAN